MPKRKPFDPEGTGYDYETAEKHGIKPNKKGKWPSRVPKTGQLLKGRKHKTFPKTVAGEKAAGHTIKKGESGKYYSKPKTVLEHLKETSPVVVKKAVKIKPIKGW